MVTLWADLTGIAIPTYIQGQTSICYTLNMIIILASNALQYGSKWSDTNACSNHDCMLSLEDVHGGCTIWTIDEHL